MNTAKTNIATAEMTSLLQLSQQVECARAIAQSEQPTSATSPAA
jgi:hypothetical protein